MSSPTGRPTVITKTTVQKLEEALRDGFSVAMACHLSGISRSSYYDHLSRSPDFSDKMELAQSWATERAKQVVVQEISKGSLKAAQWWLERRNKAEFAINAPEPQQTNNLSGWLDGGKRQERFLESMADIAAEMYGPAPLAEA